MIDRRIAIAIGWLTLSLLGWLVVGLLAFGISLLWDERVMLFAVLITLPPVTWLYVAAGALALFVVVHIEHNDRGRK